MRRIPRVRLIHSKACTCMRIACRLTPSGSPTVHRTLHAARCRLGTASHAVPRYGSRWRSMHAADRACATRPHLVACRAASQRETTFLLHCVLVFARRAQSSHTVRHGSDRLLIASTVLPTQQAQVITSCASGAIRSVGTSKNPIIHPRACIIL